MTKLKVLIYHILNSNRFTRAMLNKRFIKNYTDSAGYWQTWYLNDGTSGSGSYGDLAIYKATVINKFVAENNIKNVIEFGCGDGNQLKQFRFPSYVGLDVAQAAIDKCSEMFKDDNTKSFFLYNDVSVLKKNAIPMADLSLSLDVIYHLLEDDVYEKYMHDLFSASNRFVMIYAWDTKKHKSLHIHHRKFTPWIIANCKEWKLVQEIEYQGKLEACDFFVYEKLEKPVINND